MNLSFLIVNQPTVTYGIIRIDLTECYKLYLAIDSAEMVKYKSDVKVY